MEAAKELKTYFNKLQRAIKQNAEFRFFRWSFVKKSKVEDILCCILATFPDSYKKMLHMSGGKHYNSILSYNLLLHAIKQKCLFNPNVYMVNVNNASKKISIILQSIEQDIRQIEKYYNNEE